MARKFKSNDERKAEIKEALGRIEEGIKDIVSGDEWAAMLKTMSKFHKYSFNNLMLIAMQRGNARQVAGFGTWKKLGRFVKKGEKSIKILAPIPRKYTKKSEVTNPTTGKKETELEEKTWMAFRLVSVFDISQTEGKELPTVAHLLEGSEEEKNQARDLLNLLTAQIEELGYSVSVEAINDGSNGYCSYLDKKIAVRDDISVVHQAKTLAHELTHALLHSPQDAIEHTAQNMCEVEAESVAFCVLNSFGIDSGNYSFGYVAGWSGANRDKVQAAAQRIQKTADQIIVACEKEINAQVKAA